MEELLTLEYWKFVFEYNLEFITDIFIPVIVGVLMIFIPMGIVIIIYAYLRRR